MLCSMIIVTLTTLIIRKEEPMMTMADLEVMQAAWLAETEKIEAGIDWKNIPAEPDNEQ